MKHLNPLRYLWLATVLALAGCQTLGIPQAETFNQRLAVGYVGVTTARQTALTLLQADKIGTDDAQQVQQQADNLRAGLDVARSLRASSPQAADSKLTATLAALQALDAYLKTRGAP